MIYQCKVTIDYPTADNVFKIQTGDVIHYNSKRIFNINSQGHISVPDNLYECTTEIHITKINGINADYDVTALRTPGSRNCSLTIREYDDNTRLSINNILIRINDRRCIIVELGAFKLNPKDINFSLNLVDTFGSKWRLHGFINYSYNPNDSAAINELHSALNKWCTNSTNRLVVADILVKIN